MPSKMERFTQKARHVLSVAQMTADNFKHNYIGTEHLLLALIREYDSVASRVLSDLELETGRTEELVKELTQATTRMPNTTLDLSPRTQRVLELAVDEARRMGHHYISTEHLLLGLVRQAEGVAIDVLKRSGISPEEVRRQTRRVLQESSIQKPQSVDSPVDAPSIPPRAPTVLTRPQTTLEVAQSISFDVLQATITRILDMVVAEKLTTSQAAELLGALQPYLSPSTVQKGQLVAQASGSDNLEKRQLRVIIRNNITRNVVFEFILPIQKVMDHLDTLVNAAFTNQAGWFWAENVDVNNSVEFHIEEGEK